MDKTKTLDNVEIFRVGTWNGIPYSEEDLQNIVDNYNALYPDKILRPKMKLGHDDNQRLLQEDGYPAAGWITGLRKVGDRLLATITDIPRRIATIIENKGYGDVSCEIWHNRVWGEKVRSVVLEAVAFLGGDVPAVESLADWEALYGKEIPYFNKQAQAHKVVCSIKKENFNNKEVPHKTEKEGSQMTPEQIAAMQAENLAAKTEIENLKGKITSLETNVSTLTKEKDDLQKESDANKANLAKQEEATAKEEVEKFFNDPVSGLVKLGKILPAEVEGLIIACLKQDNAKKETYSFNEGKDKAELTAREFFMKTLEARPVIVNFAELSKSGEQNNEPVKTYEEGTDKDSIELNESAEKFAKENKVSFKEALIAVSKLAKQTK